MNELKPIELDCNLGRDINGVAHRVPWKAYDIDEVDAVIAEKDAEIARLDDLAHAHNIELLRKENLITELKRALWLARAERAMMTLDYFTLKCRWFKDYIKVDPPECDVKMIHKWAGVERKCRAKAEAYK